MELNRLATTCSADCTTNQTPEPGSSMSWAAFLDRDVRRFDEENGVQRDSEKVAAIGVQRHHSEEIHSQAAA